MFNQLFHFPCRYNNVDLLKWLVEQSSRLKNGKVDLNTSDHAQYTPLLTAVFYKSTKCVKYLLEKMWKYCNCQLYSSQELHQQRHLRYLSKLIK